MPGSKKYQKNNLPVIKWTRPASWSTFNNLRRCPYKFELYLRKTPYINQYPNYNSTLGTIVQKVYELWFNRHHHHFDRDSYWPSLRRILIEVLESPLVVDRKITYPHGKSYKDLVVDCGNIIREAIPFWTDNFDLANCTVACEVDIHCQYKSLRMRGIVDFILTLPDNTTIYLDGKVNQKKNADPDQLLFYALLAKYAMLPVDKIGFMYWRYGLEYIKFNQDILEKFRVQEFDARYPMYNDLQTGVKNLPPSPSAQSCKYCEYCAVCEHSVFRASPRRGMGQMTGVKFT